MPVYVDNFNAPYRGMRMCHMVATTTEELLQMVDAIGVQRRHIQDAGTYREHFDICLAKKAKAVKLGAIELGFRDLAKFVNSKKHG